MKRVWRENDRSEGVCQNCRRRVPTVFRYRTVELDNPAIPVPDVLVSVCERCEAIVTIPWQSNRLLQAARHHESEKLSQAATIEARVPGQVFEALRVVAAQLEVKDEVFSSLVLRYYLSEVARDRRFAVRVCRLADSDWSIGPSNQRISLKLSASLRVRALNSASECGISNQSALMRGLVAALWHDVFRKRGRNGKRRAFIEDLATAMG